MISQLVTLPGKKYHVPVYSVTWLKDSSPYRDLYVHHAQEEIDRTFAAEEEASQEATPMRCRLYTTISDRFRGAGSKSTRGMIHTEPNISGLP